MSFSILKQKWLLQDLRDYFLRIWIWESVFGCFLSVSQILHLATVALLGHSAFMLLALQVQAKLRLLTGTRVTHRAIELPAGCDAHRKVSWDTLPRSWVVVRAWHGSIDMSPTVLH